MGSAFYIALEKEIPGFDPFVNGKAIARADGDLHSLAEALGVTPITKFYGGAWRQPQKGIATVRALLGRIREEPSCVTRVDPDNLISDLEQWLAVLLVAEEHKVRWHMLVDC